ncbi:MAG: hypothetical protein CXZ00_11130 [Acidobacteria bacterium]|nr:MAG: hypothetical protein CXZ00_11130 [Acidobacteriota bacterium]
MPLDHREVEKPLKKLRKMVNSLPKRPSAEQVHDIRTRARRMEATLHALLLDGDRKGQRVCEAIAPIRKRAGKVRDMDVLTGLALTLRGNDSDCLVRLLEQLGHWRFQDARKLHRTALRQRSVARFYLKRYRSLVNRNFKNNSTQGDWDRKAAASVLQLSGELAKWPRLTAENLHPFRLKVKQLRYVLQLSGNNEDELVWMLGQVKDKIGEWHDWMELAAIAGKVLKHDSGCVVQEQIRSKTKQCYEEAMAIAIQLRVRYFQRSSKNNRITGRESVKRPVSDSAARLAA